MELLDVNNKSYHCKNTPPQKKSPAKVHAETLCHVKKVIAEVKHVGRMTGIYRNRKLVKRGGGCWGWDLSCDWLSPPPLAVKSWGRCAAELKHRIRQPRRRWNLPRAVIHSCGPCLSVCSDTRQNTNVHIYLPTFTREWCRTDPPERENCGLSSLRIHIGKVSAA